jgi:hypothetical protein
MKFKKFFDFFPPPEYLDRKFAGLAISDNHIRVVVFGKNKNGVFLKSYKEVTLPPGVILAGNINNIDELENILTNLRKEMGICNIKACIPEEKSYLFEIEIPIVPVKLISSTVELKIEENVPLKANETIFDYNIIGVDHNNKTFKLVISAFPRSVVETYQQVLITSGFNVFSLDIESQSIARAVVPKDDKGSNMIVHFSLDKVGVYIVSQNIVHFTSTTNSLGNDGKYSLIINEVSKILHFWEDKNDYNKDKTINHIFVCGEDFDKNILDELSSKTKITASISNVWQNAFDINSFIPDISLSDSIKYASAIGLALPSDFFI